MPRRARLGGDALSTAALADRLRDRLAELDAERVRLVGALAALEASVPRAPVNEERLVEAIRASPGARRSMLALVCGVPMTSIAAQIDGLAKAGIVERDGLGWRLRDPAAAAV